MNDRTAHSNAWARTHRLIVAVGFLLCCVGCSLTGDWRTVGVAPASSDDMRMLSAISFASDGRYTATEHWRTERTTSTGRFNWNGMRLKLVPDNGTPRDYACKRNMDGSLTIQYANSVTATLRASD